MPQDRKNKVFEQEEAKLSTDITVELLDRYGGRIQPLTFGVSITKTVNDELRSDKSSQSQITPKFAFFPLATSIDAGYNAKLEDDIHFFQDHLKDNKT